MSGHSKWSKLKHTKPIADAKKSQGFSRVSNLIAIAAKQGGNSDPKLNPLLKEAIEKAKQINLPRENIERAIKRGLGLIPGAIFEELNLEAYGPNNVAMVIQIATDNRNRTLPEIKKTLSIYGGSLAGVGSVLWMFREVGHVSIPRPLWPQDPDFELKTIDAGAEEIILGHESVSVLCQKERLKTLEEFFKQSRLGNESHIEFFAETMIKIADEEKKQRIIKLVDELQGREDVNAIFHNAEL